MEAGSELGSELGVSGKRTGSEMTSKTNPLLSCAPLKAQKGTIPCSR